MTLGDGRPSCELRGLMCGASELIAQAEAGRSGGQARFTRCDCDNCPGGGGSELRRCAACGHDVFSLEMSRSLAAGDPDSL